MKLPLLYAIGTLLIVVIDTWIDVVGLLNDGKLDKLTESIGYLGWAWVPLSIVAMIFFVISKVPIRLPVVFVVYYAVGLVLSLLLMLDPKMRADPLQLPLWVFVMDLLMNCVLTWLSMHLIKFARISR